MTTTLTKRVWQQTANHVQFAPSFTFLLFSLYLHSLPHNYAHAMSWDSAQCRLSTCKSLSPSHPPPWDTRINCLAQNENHNIFFCTTRPPRNVCRCFVCQLWPHSPSVSLTLSLSLSVPIFLALSSTTLYTYIASFAYSLCSLCACADWHHVPPGRLSPLLGLCINFRMTEN